MAAAGQDAQERAQNGAAYHGGGDALEIVLGEPEVLDRLDHNLAGLGVFQIAQDFRDPEDADGDRDEIDALEQFAEPEGEARRAGIDILADHAEQQAENDHGQRLEDGAVREGNGDQKAQDDQGEIFRRSEIERGAGQGRREIGQKEGRDRAGKERAERGGGEGRAGAALLGHLVAVDGGHRR